jgi:sortase A
MYIRSLLVVLLLVAGLAAGMLYARHHNRVPALLINQAWARTLDGVAEIHPWPGLESVPVAKIILPDMNREHVIMSGVSGDVLAVAPGWHEGTDFPGQPGISLISAYGNTHFGFLRHLQEGDVFTLETRDGNHRSYLVSEMSIVQESEMKVAVGKDESVLLLSTSYPLSNWQQGEKVRLVVVARETGPEKRQGPEV